MGTAGRLSGSAVQRRRLEVTDPREGQRTPPVVGLVWTLLVVNTLGSGGEDTIFPIPARVAQLITMGALAVAFTLALIVNARLRIRPSGFLLVLSLLVVVSVISSAVFEPGLGALARCARLALFIATLWLLTPWWNGTLAFVHHHIRVLGALLVSVVLGLALAPGLAMPENYGGRLTSVLWYLPPPQVAHIAAVTAGLAVVLWLGRRMSGRHALWIAVPSVTLLILTHTRTATIALVAGLVVAGLSLVITTARSRRALAACAVVAVVVSLAFGSALVAWFRRGQGAEALEELTGRQKVWNALLAEPRTPGEQLFGVGLTDKSFDGLPIDSAWLAVYHEQGLVGVAIVSAFLAVLVIAAATRPPSPARACAAFLLVYCLVASYTEVGLGDASLYLLELALAGGLLLQRRTSVSEQASASRESS